MKVHRSRCARSTALIAAFVAAPLGSVHAAQIAGGHTEPTRQLERLVRPSCDADGIAQGTYTLPSSSVGSLDGDLIDEYGESAYTLVADLTTYLPIFDPRQPRYGGIEGFLIPHLTDGGVLPVDLHVRGSWAQQPGQAATFEAEIFEVNAVTGTIYGTVGLIHGSFQPGQGLAIAAGGSATRIDAALQPARARDAQPPEQQAVPASLGQGGFIPPPPSQGGRLPERQAPDVHGLATGGSLQIVAQQAGGHAPGRERVRLRREVLYDHLPPAHGGIDREVPGAQSADVHGASAAASLSASKLAGAHQPGKEQSYRRILVPYDDLPPTYGPTHQVPDQQDADQQGGIQGSTAHGAARAHGGAIDGASERPVVLPETGLFFATWGICN